MSKRNPYGFPSLENDDDFVDPKGESVLNSSGQSDTVKLSPGEADPWSRLNATETLSSYRRGVCYHDPQSPQDNLDFVLKCQYDHHKGLLKSKAETLIQPETLGMNHGRILKNRVVVSEPLKLETKELVTFCEPNKSTVDSTKGLAIESHHSEATNRGFSRKQDGGFY